MSSELIVNLIALKELLWRRKRVPLSRIIQGYGKPAENVRLTNRSGGILYCLVFNFIQVIIDDIDCTNNIKTQTTNDLPSLQYSSSNSNRISDVVIAAGCCNDFGV